MDLRDYLRVLRRGWAVILTCVVLGTGVGVLLTVLTPSTYRASVQIFVAVASGDNTTLNGGGTFTQDRVQSYTAIANSPKVTDVVVANLKLSITSGQLSKKISATAPQNRSLIDISVTDRDPVLAARLANAVAEVFNTVVANNIEQTIVSASAAPASPSPSASASGGTDTGGTPVVKLTTIVPATVPTNPASPHKVINIALGFIIGLLGGVGLVVLRAVLDTTLKGPEDFEALGVPVLGFVPMDKRAARSPIAFRGDPHSSRSEAYRSIRTNMQFVDIDNPPRLIAVTSAMPGEGKSTTAINLAAALAEAGYRVCLVDADLRRPSIAKTLGLVGDVGFTTVLIGDTPVEDVLQNSGRNFAVLTSGQIPPNPSELLLSSHARTMILELAEQVDFVVLDTPPLLPVTDAAELATVVDATVLVARFGKTTREQSARSIAALAKVGEKPVGVIVNMVTQARGASDYQYGYYYTPYRPERNRSDKAETKTEDKARGRRARRAAEQADAAAPDAEDGATPETTAESAVVEVSESESETDSTPAAEPTVDAGQVGSGRAG